jgi:hypothetical protein
VKSETEVIAPLFDQLPDAARLTGYSPSWLRRACDEGWGPEFFIVNGRRVFERQTLVTWIKSNPSPRRPRTEEVSA